MCFEYASPVWHSGLTKTQSDDIERVQKRCMRIVFPQLSYSDALVTCGLEPLSVRRENAVIKLFNEIKNNSKHILNDLLPKKLSVDCDIATRCTYPYRLPIIRTGRPLRSFIYYCVRKKL